MDWYRSDSYLTSTPPLLCRPIQDNTVQPQCAERHALYLSEFVSRITATAPLENLVLLGVSWFYSSSALSRLQAVFKIQLRPELTSFVKVTGNSIRRLLILGADFVSPFRSIQRWALITF
jgi:hypothetical protein